MMNPAVQIILEANRIKVEELSKSVMETQHQFENMGYHNQLDVHDSLVKMAHLEMLKAISTQLSSIELLLFEFINSNNKDS